MNYYSSTNNTVQAVKRDLRVLHFYDSYAIISGNDITQVSHMSVSVLWPTVSDLVGVEVPLHGLAAMLHVPHLVDVEAVVSRGESCNVSKEPHRGGWATCLVEVNHAGDLVRVDYSHSVVLQISIIVWPHIQLMHGTPVLVYSRGLPIIQRPPLRLPWGEGELGLLVAGVTRLKHKVVVQPVLLLDGEDHLAPDQESEYCGQPHDKL